MQDLRIVGVDAEGPTPRLLLSDSTGAEYALVVDQGVQTAVADLSRPRQAQNSPALSPRDIQARLRSGATLEQVVADSGHTREHVLRYAGPVADERAFFATRARGTVVAGASTSEHHRLAFGDAPATLEAMVKVRLRAMGVALDTLSWDAWRREDGLWAVACDFDATSSQPHSAGIGQQPPAEWAFDPRARSVHAQNEWAESLSSLPAPNRSRTVGRRLAAVDEPFNVDEQPQTSGAEAGTGHEDLLDILRARRGQRLGTDETGDDKLATLLTRDEQPAPAQEQSTDPLPGLGEDQTEEQSADADPEPDSPADTDAWGFSYTENAEDSGTADDDAEPAPPAKKRSTSRRPAMPRWDDILFGSRE